MSEIDKVNKNLAISVIYSVIVNVFCYVKRY